MRRRLHLLPLVLTCLALTARLSADTAPRSERTSARSLATLLTLDDYQLSWLDRIHDEFARTHAEENEAIAGWRDELRRAESKTPPDEARVRRLVRDISTAEERIADAHIHARAQAYRVLTRRQERELANLRDSGAPFRRDRYRDMLVRSVEDVWESPSLKEAERAANVPMESYPGFREAPVAADDPDFVVKPRPKPDISARVDPSIRDHQEPRGSALETKGPYTSLIIDCRDFGVERSMAPRIRVSDNREVWGTVDVDPDWVIEHGIVVYAHSMREAMRSDRAGSNPLVVRAVGRAGGNFNSDAVISERDADRILKANGHDKMLDKFRVIFILDQDL